MQLTHPYYVFIPMPDEGITFTGFLCKVFQR